MASSLASHLCAFLFFFLIGVRRLVAFFSLYLKNSHHHQFRSKPWYLFHSSSTPCFDLYILLITIPVASFSDLYLFLSIPPHRFHFLHHQAIFTFFWLLLLLILLTQHHTQHSPPLLLLPDTFLFLFAFAAFLVDYYFIINNNDDVSVSSVVYNLSGVLSLLCAASCIYLSVCPYSFLAEFALSAGLVFKGTWVMQAGLNLNSDVFGFKGCQKIVTGQMSDVIVKCDLQEDTLRAVALIDLLFVCHSIGILVATFALFAFLSASNCAAAGLSTGVGDATGPLLPASDQLEPPDSVQFEIQ
ncbi:hypothetical protein QQ045_028511 [Rhodiola kirilowii]